MKLTTAFKSIASAMFILLLNDLPVIAQQPSLKTSNGTAYILGGNEKEYGITYDASGNLYIAGSFAATASVNGMPGTDNLVSAGSDDIFLASYTATGAFRWAKGIGGSGSEIARAIAVDASGNVYITGTNNSYSVNFDPGNTATAASTISVANSNSDGFIASYTSTGTFRWVKAIGGTNVDDGYGITVDASSNITIVGSFSSSTVNFNPGFASNASNTYSSSGNADIFLASYTGTGTFRYAKAIGSSSQEYGMGIAADAAGNTFITGSTTSTACNFNPGASTTSANTSTVYGNFDIYLASYDNNGAFRWLKSIGGNSTDQGYAVAVDNSGNVSVTGAYLGAGINFNPGASATSVNTPPTYGGTYAYDIFVASYTNAGGFNWVKGIGGTGQDFGYGIAADANGNVIATGVSASTGVNFNPGASGNAANTFSAAGFQDAFIVSYSVSGAFNWAKDIGSAGSATSGYDVAVTAAGTVGVAGFFSAQVDFNPGSTAAVLSTNGNDGFILQLSSTGTYSFASDIGYYGSNTGGMAGKAIAYDAAGNSYMAGFFNNTHVNFGTTAAPFYLTAIGGNDVYLISYDAAGTVRWGKSIGGVSSDQALGITIDNASDIYVTGSVSSAVNFDPGAVPTMLNTPAFLGGSDIFIASYNSNGSFRWAKLAGGAAYDEGAAIATDGTNIFITGRNNSAGAVFDPGATSTSANTVSTAGSYDIFVASYSGNGTFRWVKNIGGSGYDQGYGIAADAGTGNVFITGVNASTGVNFDPANASNSTNTVATSGTTYDIFIASYTNAGGFRWVKDIGGTGYEMGYGIATDASGNIYATGVNNSPGTNFDPGATSSTANTFSTAGGNDIFIASYTGSGTFRWAKDIGGSGTDNGAAIATDNTGSVYVTGYISSAGVNFNPGATSTAANTPPFSGGTPIFIASYAGANGSFAYANTFASSGNNYGYGIAAGSSGVVYLTGQKSSGALNVNPFGSNLLPATPTSGIFTASYSQCYGPLVASSSTVTTITRTISGATTLQNDCVYAATVTPSGTTPVSGSITATVYVDNTVPTYSGHAYVARRYDLLPATGANSATGTITLYYTQQDFDDYNAANGSDLDLPTGASDASGIANLRITQAHGTSSTGLPGSYNYTGAGAKSVLIDPMDSKIVYNMAAQRWEVTFSVTGFSGFFVTGNLSTPLPVILVDFSAVKQNETSNRIMWQTGGELPGTSFEVERSNDAQLFNILGAVPSKGSHSFYTFEDDGPLTGDNFYRLRVTEANGNVNFTKTVLLTNSANNGGVVVSPIPAAQSVVITNTDKANDNLPTAIYDMSGNEMIRFIMKPINIINISAWRPGMYSVALPSGKGVKLFRQ